MRTTLLYGLLETLRTNVNNGRFDLKIFERGKIFIADGAEGLLPVRMRKSQPF